MNAIVKILSPLLLLLIPHFSNGQSMSISRQVDSLQLLMKAAISKEDQAAQLMQIGRIYKENLIPDLAIQQYKKAQRIIDADNFPDLFATTQLNIGEVFLETNVFKADSALVYINNAYKLYSSISPKVKLECLHHLTWVNYALYRFEEAIQYCLEGIELAKELKEEEMLRYFYTRMSAFSLLHLKDEEKVLEYTDLALHSAVKNGAPSTMSYYYLMSAINYHGLELYEETLSLLDSCEKYIVYSKRKNLIIDLYMTRGRAYTGIDEFTKAEQNFYKALAIADSNKVWTRKMHIPLSLAQLSLKRNEFDKAIGFSTTALTIVPDKLTLFELEKANRQLYEAYRGKQDYKNALDYYEQWKNLQDSMTQINNLNTIAGLESKYQNQVQKKQIQSQQEEITWQRKLRNIIIGFLMLLLIASTALFIMMMTIRNSREKIKEQHQLISEQADELKYLDKAKSRFFANVSHELRTPLTLMLGPINAVLNSNELSKPNIKSLVIAQQNGKELERLISTILDLSKMDSGKMELEEQVLIPFDFIRQLIANFAVETKEKDIQLLFNSQVDKNLQILIDKNKFKTIINVLLSNAIRFTPANGEVAVHLNDLNTGIEVIIMDNGRGIHPKDLPHIFDRFYQTSEAKAVAEGGTGISLTLAQEFAKLMGGEIRVDSQLGKGSSFTLILPKKLV